jgi:hypothetical protein
MWGFNISSGFRPQNPMINLTFNQWWFHGYLDTAPPHPNDIKQLPVGQNATTELSCDKDATSWWPSGPGGDRQQLHNPSPCPGSNISEFHTTGIHDLGGCALAVAYKSDAFDVQPDDFVVFSVNHTCVWYLHTNFGIPADMPPCPDGKCICAWFWIHKPDSGSMQSWFICCLGRKCIGLTDEQIT